MKKIRKSNKNNRRLCFSNQGASLTTLTTGNHSFRRGCTFLRSAYRLLLLFVAAFLMLEVLAACAGADDVAAANYGSYEYSPEAIQPEPVQPNTNDSKYIYFSYDDSASTASVELVKYKLEHDQKPDTSLARPWEFLNFESFDPGMTNSLGLFTASMGLWKRDAHEGSASEYRLGVYVASPERTMAERSNAVITLVIDISGSMDSFTCHVEDISTTRMDLLRYGLNRMINNSLKDGDIVNIVTFNSTASVVAENYSYPDDKQALLDAVNGLDAGGSTNLDEGLNLGYDKAEAYYESSKLNRVILLTDAYANVGETCAARIADKTVINEAEGIYFSGLGISADFNEAFLNELTEQGKGAYFTLATKTDARKAFEERFIALLDVAARHVVFRLDYPAILTHDTTASEESSTNKQDILPTNFSYNTSQYFYEGFSATNGEPAGSATFKLTIYYKDPVTFVEKEETLTCSISDILGEQDGNIRDAEMIYLFTELIGEKDSWSNVSSILTAHYTNYASSLFSEYSNMMALWRNL